VSPFFNVRVGPQVVFCETAIVVGVEEAPLTPDGAMALSNAAPVASTANVVRLCREILGLVRLDGALGIG
jgi:hypothetical protein